MSRSTRLPGSAEPPVAGEGEPAGTAGLYVHIPFCVHRCGYCDFVTYADKASRMDEYLGALGHEAARRAGEARELATVYLGGGTPSLLGPAGLARVFGTVVDRWPRGAGAEVSVESNPESVDRTWSEALVRHGATRVSLGAQSFDAGELALMERAHDAAAIGRAVETLRRAGIRSVSLDLIYGLPGAGVPTFMKSLEAALGLSPDHLSLYALTMETGSRWGREREALGLAEPDGDLQADMYEAATARLAAEGYRAYEISNFARPGHESRHNLRYWRGEPVLGLGVGAWGGECGRRVRNAADFETYLADQAHGRGPFPSETLDPVEAARERVVLRLRTADGVVPEDWQGAAEAARSRAVLERYRGLGLVAGGEPVYSLTERGRMLAHVVMAELI